MKIKKIISFIFLLFLFVLTSCEDKECIHKSIIWVVDKKATCTEEGLKHEECSRCHKKFKEEIISVTGHNYENGECLNCHKRISIGLKYKLNEDNKTYSVIGVGNCTDTEIIIPDTYNDLPVTVIEDSLFDIIVSLLSIEIPNSVVKIENMGNIRTKDIGSIYYNGTIEDWCKVTLNSSIFYLTKHIYMKNSDNEYKEVTEIEIPDTITKIDDYQFYGFKNTTKVTIPNSVTSIGEHAFQECSSLTSIEIPNSVTNIGNYAFEDCSSLTSIELPNSVISIGTSTFLGCNGLVTIINNTDLELTLESSDSGNIAAYKLINKDGSITYKEEDIYTYIETIDNFLFRYDSDNNYQLVAYLGTEDTVTLPYYINGSSYELYEMKGVRNVILPNTFTNINDYAFRNCSSLISIGIPNSVRTIGDGAFRNCVCLTKVEIPNSVRSIERAVFFSCTSLTSIKIPNSVTIIEDGVFNQCKNLTSIEIPNSIMRIKDYVFIYCSNLENVYYDGNIEDWCNIIFDSGYSNPMCYAKYFYMKDVSGEYKEVTEIVLPDSITSIDKYQFSGFKNVSIITISNSITNIEDYAFEGCDSVTSIEIPNSVTSIGDYAFSSCDSLTRLTIPTSITSYGKNIFSNCNSLYSVYYEGTIEDWCNIKFNSEDTNPMSYANHFFIKDESGEYKEATEIVLPDTITEISNYQFYGFKNVTKIIIPNSVTSIGKAAFSRCDGLTSITLPFVGSSLSDANNNYFGYIFGANSSSDNTYSVPKSLNDVKITGGTSIGFRAFYNCNNLTSIEIPNTITTICKDAFIFCSNLISMKIPDSVTSIESNAFAYCYCLTSIYISNNVEILEGSVFSECTSLTIYCEASSQPDGWTSSWNESDCPVIWDYKSK